ncbi:MotA/TolQ/ExbB proton channel family protein [Thiomicrorhabdus sp. 6S3-12]|uniref:MotA/TolQ/ExbB proton channel family protein n=1 Tax=Thiomicrorhabdus sp. 6S3-12 TaxID=2819681 RepID=UPI001AAC9621|nr:MotA/TolQ/ExbB proton channel family protein [Thiomicrorhabdus sp. 6S3-12]MBO1923359.1 MotA/TolQ/ExbB proton channel family protein [Thiomicrorhabdus sp. 6S3-12]
MNFIEMTMAEIAGLFLMPVLIILALMFAFAFYELGRFGWEWLMRSLGKDAHQPLQQFWAKNPQADQQEVELQLLRQIEPLRLVSRIAPMLGLVATMIPMGPALMAVANGNFQEVASQLTVAFAAVIIALLSASMTFMTLSVRRRWLLEELKALLKAKAKEAEAEPKLKAA